MVNNEREIELNLHYLKREIVDLNLKFSDFADKYVKNIVYFKELEKYQKKVFVNMIKLLEKNKEYFDFKMTEDREDDQYA